MLRIGERLALRSGEEGGGAQIPDFESGLSTTGKSATPSRTVGVPAGAIWLEAVREGR